MAQKFTVPVTIKNLTSAGSDGITVFLDQESFARLKVEAGGRITWGDGAGAGDTNLYRDSANALKTDDSFQALGGIITLATSGSPSTSIADGALAVDTANDKFYFRSGGEWVQVSATTQFALDDLTDVSASSPSSGDFLKWNGTAWVNDPINLGADTTGNYVSDVSGGTGVTVTHTPGEGSTPSIAIGQAVGTSASVTFAHVTADLTGNASTASALQTPRIVQLSGDVSGSASFDGSANINISTTVNSGSVAIGELAGVSLVAPIEEYQVIQYDGTVWTNEYPDTVSYVRNVDTVTLTPGMVVYIFGGNGDHATVKRADNSSDTTSSKTLGVVAATITAGNNGPVVTRGYVDSIDLDPGYTEGQVLWLGKNGAFTTTKPSAPDHLVYIGVVVRATNNGIVYVACQNGYELEELHNVKINGVSDGQFLRYNSASTVWVNDTINLGTDTAGDYVQSLVAGTGVTLSNNSGESATPTIAIGQSVATSASVTFAKIDTTGDVTVGGNLTVNGTTTTLNTETLAIEDNIIVLNSNVSGSPSINAGIEVERGTSTNVSVRWNETSDKWELTNDGSSYGVIAQLGSIALGTDTTGNYVSDVSAGTGISVSHTPGEGSTATVSINATLDNLSDVAVSSAVNGDYLKFNGSSWVSASIEAGGGAGITVSDTAPSTPSEGDLWFDSVTLVTFIYYSSAWVDISSYDNQFTELESLTDVLISSPTPNQILKYNGTEWINSSLPTTDGITEGTTNLYFTDERAHDAVNSALVAGTGLQKTYNDASNTLTLNVVATTDDISEGATRLYFTNERAHDAINELITAGTGVTKQYDDNANTMTILIGQDVATSASPTFSAVNINSGIVFEGSTVDSYETTLNVVDPTADRTITLPNISGTVAIAETTFNTQTENYTLTASDKDKLVEMNKSTANTLTVPLNSSVPFAIGTRIDVFQYGSGKTQVVGASGVDVRATPGAYLRAQYSSATLIKRATNEWILIGDLSAS